MQNFKNTIGKIALVFMLIFSTTNMYSRHVPYTGKSGGGPTSAADCASAVAVAEIFLNNVRARIEGTGGSMWQDRPNGLQIMKSLKGTILQIQNIPLFTLVLFGWGDKMLMVN